MTVMPRDGRGIQYAVTFVAVERSVFTGSSAFADDDISNYRFRSINPCISRCGSSVRNDRPNTPMLRLTDSSSGSSSH